MSQENLRSSNVLAKAPWVMSCVDPRLTSEIVRAVKRHVFPFATDKIFRFKSPATIFASNDKSLDVHVKLLTKFVEEQPEDQKYPALFIVHDDCAAVKNGLIANFNDSYVEYLKYLCEELHKNKLFIEIKHKIDFQAILYHHDKLEDNITVFEYNSAENSLVVIKKANISVS